jgi:hypothetical protein
VHNVDGRRGDTSPDIILILGIADRARELVEDGDGVATTLD